MYSGSSILAKAARNVPDIDVSDTVLDDERDMLVRRQEEREEILTRILASIPFMCTCLGGDERT